MIGGGWNSSIERGGAYYLYLSSTETFLEYRSKERTYRIQCLLVTCNLALAEIGKIMSSDRQTDYVSGSGVSTVISKP